MNTLEKSNLYITRTGSLAKMGIFSQELIDGFGASKSITEKMLILDRREIFDRGALMLCHNLIRTIELKNTPK